MSQMKKDAACLILFLDMTAKLIDPVDLEEPDEKRTEEINTNRKIVELWSIPKWIFMIRCGTNVKYSKLSVVIFF